MPPAHDGGTTDAGGRRPPPLRRSPPIPLVRWRVTALEHVMTATTARPFKARGVDDAGREAVLCVKPLVPSVGADGLMAAAELLGGVIGREIGVSVAEVGLAWLSSGFLASAGPTLNHVEPGWAVATRWVEASFSAAGMAQHSVVVVNPDSVAGVTVLDTLLSNPDRANNVLLESVGGGGTRSFALRYIDHGWGLGGCDPTSLLSAGADEDAVTCLAPDDDALCALVRSQESFLPYLLAAEALPLDLIDGVAASVPALGWDVGNDYARRVRTHLSAAISHVRPVVMRSLSRFPNCV
jgi:hypothetical protein